MCMKETRLLQLTHLQHHIIYSREMQLNVEVTAVQNLLYTVLLYKLTAGEESTLGTYHKSSISQEVANTQCAW